MRTAVELTLYETKEGTYVLNIRNEINITKYFKPVNKPSTLEIKEDGFLIQVKEKE